MFAIAFTPSALGDIGWFPKRGRVVIFERIEEQLAREPAVETRDRKKLRPNQVAEWELRVDRYRVFYDVDANAMTVEVKMVAQKEGNKLLVRGKEYDL